MIKYNMNIVESASSDGYKKALKAFINKLLRDGVPPGNINRDYSPYQGPAGAVYSCQIDWWVKVS
ncbi:MAG: hypothetical protein DRP42_05220 [Tenericutes bacterium]|nr:MAG: hypothetical protein DRP42_05220 [Mycoplasmatota bacterium]